MTIATLLSHSSRSLSLKASSSSYHARVVGCRLSAIDPLSNFNGLGSRTSTHCHLAARHLYTFTTTTTTTGPLGSRPASNVSPLVSPSLRNQVIRFFQTEGAYHTVADETLEDLVDAVEGVLEDHFPASSDVDFEVGLAAGVLTISIPPHGTWVINKQTPNQQLWWSSPLSGPKRFEYEDDIWVSTKDGLALVPLLSQELSHVLGKTVELEL